MALFGTKKNTAKKAAPAKKTVAPKAEKAAVQTEGAVRGTLVHVLRNPRITEKATMQQFASVYAFDVAPDVTKTQITEAVRNLYKVVPTKIAIVSIPTKRKRNMRSGKIGVKGGGKKAYVYLKKGETISIA